MRRLLFALAILVSWVGGTLAQEAPAHVRQEDLVYGRKFGTALTLDVFTPEKNANGAAIVWVISGGWFSSHEGIRPAWTYPMLQRGYTVFAVVHGSQPRFQIPECVADVQRAVRFIRLNAERFKIDPRRIGVTGGSAGGHLSCMLGSTGDDGDKDAKDPVLRESSRVQAVGCFYPPTDFLNYGEPNHIAIGRGTLENFKAPFAFLELDPKRRMFVPITDETRILELGRQISPVTHVSADDAPTLIVHGDADKLVPIQQAELFINGLDKVGVATQLVRKPGLAHGWPNIVDDLQTILDWFDRHLAAKPKP